MSGPTPKEWREGLFLFLTAPARGWMWVCGQLCGLDVEGGFQGGDDDEDDW
jgi:hypothetical protein